MRWGDRLDWNAIPATVRQEIEALPDAVVVWAITSPSGQGYCCGPTAVLLRWSM